MFKHCPSHYDHDRQFNDNPETGDRLCKKDKSIEMWEEFRNVPYTKKRPRAVVVDTDSNVIGKGDSLHTIKCDDDTNCNQDVKYWTYTVTGRPNETLAFRLEESMKNKDCVDGKCNLQGTRKTKTRKTRKTKTKPRKSNARKIKPRRSKSILSKKK